MSRVSIYDTTLRDGSQGEGVNFSLQDKLLLTRRLDEIGVDYIEGGYPLSNPKDFEYFQAVRDLPLSHSKVCAFGMTRKKNTAPENDTCLKAILDAKTPVVTIVGKTWDFHVTNVLGTTLESVQQRFSRMGLEVSWHGTGQVLLPGEVLDAFLLALAECLENVRRHSGVTEAHVTITEDESIVRALVTDSGVGFDINDIDDAKLGFTESVVARLRDVGGNARLFSAPGSGTTVVLEVPR